MKNFITRGFILLLVGTSWLFDCKPNNLYFVWSILYKGLALSFLFHLLFDAKIEFK